MEAQGQRNSEKRGNVGGRGVLCAGPDRLHFRLLWEHCTFHLAVVSEPDILLLMCDSHPFPASAGPLIPEPWSTAGR